MMSSSIDLCHGPHGKQNHLPLFLLCFLSLFTAAANADGDELQILLNLSMSLKTENASLFTSWMPASSPCQFRGVTCNKDGSVMEIDLSNQHLTGSLPLESICELKNLTKLALGFNSLYGTLPKELNNCTKLQYLDLGNNFFTGWVPDMSSLSELRYLYLNRSGFSGAFPWNSLKNMTNLIALSVGDNPFDRTPFPEEIGNLPRLNWLYMSNCSIEGKILPSVGNLSELGSLELSENLLTGDIPREIGNLINLWRLELYQNNLSGNLPVGFRNLTKLEFFDASRNFLEGDLRELRFLRNIVSLQLFMNQFSGEIPVEFGQFERLLNLSLYRNMLNGSLPQELGSWAQFNYIDVSENFLVGTIPPDMCKQGTMTALLMLQNNFSGEIPGTYADCSTLTRFRVSNNSLSGVVPAGIWGLPKVNLIDISLNQLEGPITNDIKNAKSINQLLVGNNRLSGELPKEISEIESLVEIDLSYNQFSGKIPTGIGDLKGLSSLHLQYNMLSGTIPGSLGTCVSLSYLNMAHNLISGEIPTSLGSLPILNSLNLSNNQLIGRIPSSLSFLKLSLLDLSNNQLSGPIPQSFSIDVYNGSFSGNTRLCTYTKNGSFKRCSPSHTAKTKYTFIVVICFLTALMLLFALLGCFFYAKRRENYQARSLREESWEVKSFHALTFTEDDILDSIKQQNLIGQGGSGNVYKVTLPNGQDLAVKHIWRTGSVTQNKNLSTSPMLRKNHDKSRELDSEVWALSSIRHVNVVKLYCSITSEDSSLLVYEYLPNGSLWDWLHRCGKLDLDWETTYGIAFGAAKGLEYLHHGCQRPMIHRDVKSSNILLDESMKPKIADFGLAKMVHPNGGKESTQVIAGTHGYIAPEYGYTSKVNEKSDVYSFGVVLMELVTGKRPIEPEFGDNKDIVSWVSSKLKSRESVLSLVDSRIVRGLREDAIQVLRIAILCTDRHPSLRPSMRHVVQMLKDAAPGKLAGIVIENDRVARGKSGPETGESNMNSVY